MMKVNQNNKKLIKFKKIKGLMDIFLGIPQIIFNFKLRVLNIGNKMKMTISIKNISIGPYKGKSIENNLSYDDDVARIGQSFHQDISKR